VFHPQQPAKKVFHHPQQPAKKAPRQPAKKVFHPQQPAKTPRQPAKRVSHPQQPAKKASYYFAKAFLSVVSNRFFFLPIFFFSSRQIVQADFCFFFLVIFLISLFILNSFLLSFSSRHVSLTGPNKF
jgi:hypothetical protein